MLKPPRQQRVEPKLRPDRTQSQTGPRPWHPFTLTPRKPSVRSHRRRKVFPAPMMLSIPPGPFRAYLFDCDGTIVDSMPLHYIA
jgi:hypothetical protein